MKRNLKLAIVILLALMVMGAGKKFSGKVLRVIGGDTLVVQRGEKSEIVHVYAVECPEREQPFGEEAQKFSSELVFQKVVTVKIVDKSVYKGQVFIIGEVILADKRKLSHELLKAGMAWYYEAHAPDEWRLEQLQYKARAARKGLWQDKDPVPPWEWRETHPKKKAKRKGEYTGGFCASKRSMIYHPCNCPSVFDIKHEYFIRFETEKEARKTGRVHCKCKQK